MRRLLLITLCFAACQAVIPDFGIDEETDTASDTDGARTERKAPATRDPEATDVLPAVEATETVGAPASDEQRFAEELATAAARAGVTADKRQAEWETARRSREQALAELQAALEEVKRLSGLIPICAHCKKVRDDGGYWNRIESFLRQHSEAEFTHGICPDCASRYFPEEAGPPGSDPAGR